MAERQTHRAESVRADERERGGGKEGKGEGEKQGKSRVLYYCH